MSCNHDSKYKSCLFKVPIFSHLSTDDQKGISELIKVREIKKGDFIYQSGDHNNFFVVHHGQVKISRFTENGDENVIRILSTGDFAGERSLFSQEITNDYAISLEDTMLCTIDGRELIKHMIDKPEISIKMINELSNRLSDIEVKLEEVSYLSVEQRLASSIIKLSGGRKNFTLPISKSNWASMLGMSQETLSRKLRDFKENNIINLEGQRGIVIKDLDKLKKI